MGNCLPKRKSKGRNKVGPMPTVPVKEHKREKQISEVLSGSNSSINTALSEEELTMVQAFEHSNEEMTSVKTFIMQPVETVLDEIKTEATVEVKKAVSFQIDYVQGMRRMPSRLAERLETKPEVVKSQQQVLFTDEDEAMMDAILAESEANEKRRALEEKQKAAEMLREERLKAIREKAKVMQSRPPTRAGVVTTISKLIKTCVLRITNSALYFILSEKVVNGGIQIWCELPQGHFFDEYAMEGVSADANEIYLELEPENVVKAMKTGQNAKWVKIKLTKKHSPCLTIEVDLPTLGNHSRVVTHDIPVSVVPRRLWMDYKEPEVPQFDVSIVMPQLKVLRNIIDKMKNLSHTLMLSANNDGQLKLSVETDMVAVSTHFQDLLNPTSRNDNNTSQTDGNDTKQFYESKIDIRKFSQFLAGQQVNPRRVICNIVDNSVVHFYLMNDDMSLQYFIPVMVT